MLPFSLEFISSQSEALVHGQKHSKSLINIFALNKMSRNLKHGFPPTQSGQPTPGQKAGPF